MKAPTILVVLYPEMSKAHTSFRLSKRLKESGYRIVYVGPSRPKPHILMHGFEYKVLEPDGTFQQKIAAEHQLLLQKQKTTSGLGKLGKLRLHVRLQTEMEDRLQEDLRERTEAWLKSEPPVLVLLDTLVWEKSIPFLKLKIPMLILNTCLTAAVNWKIPPVFSGIVPPERGGLLSRIKNLAAWGKISAGYWWEDFTTYVKKRMAFGFASMGTGFSPVKEARKYGGVVRRCEYGYRLKGTELHMMPPQFDFPTLTAVRGGCYVGTCVEPKRIEMPVDMKKINLSKPLVYCSAGSHPLPGLHKLYPAVVEAARRLPHIHLLVKVFNEGDVEKLKPLPDNVTVVTWAPQIKILSRAALFITHGGSSSVRESIYFGVPMIVFPSCWDQTGIASRVKFHHLGVKGDLGTIDAGMVGDFIDQVLNDQSYRQSVNQMRDVFRLQEDCAQGVDFILGFLKSHR